MGYTLDIRRRLLLNAKSFTSLSILLVAIYKLTEIIFEAYVQFGHLLESGDVYSVLDERVFSLICYRSISEARQMV